MKKNYDQDDLIKDTGDEDSTEGGEPMDIDEERAKLGLPVDKEPSELDAEKDLEDEQLPED